MREAMEPEPDRMKDALEAVLDWAEESENGWHVADLARWGLGKGPDPRPTAPQTEGTNDV